MSEEEKMKFIEKNLPARLLKYFKKRIAVKPELLHKVYMFSKKFAVPK